VERLKQIIKNKELNKEFLRRGEQTHWTVGRREILKFVWFMN